MIAPGPYCLDPDTGETEIEPALAEVEIGGPHERPTLRWVCRVCTGLHGALIARPEVSIYAQAGVRVFIDARDDERRARAGEDDLCEP